MTDTYDFSMSFMFINGQWDSIHLAFIDYIEKGLELVEQKEKDLSESMRKLEEENPEVNYDVETDEKINIHYFQTTFLNAGLMYIFSQFEHYLGEIEISAKELFDINKPKKHNWLHKLFVNYKGKKNRNNIIERRKAEIIKVCSLINEFRSKYKSQWDRFLDYQKIRNIITHANGTFGKKTLEKRFKINYPDLLIINQINGSYDLYLSKTFLLQIEQEITSFLRGFMELIYESYKSHNKHSSQQR